MVRFVLSIVILIIGFEFVQYPLEQFFDEIVKLNLCYKNYKSENSESNHDVNNLDDDFDSLLKELNVNILIIFGIML